METINNDEKQQRALLDNLFEEVRSFQYAREVKALFEYCRRMQHLSAYNAALVYTQQPGTQLVLTAKQWKKERRQVVPNARPLVILLPFGPVGFVYDIVDTEPLLGNDTDEARERLIDLYIKHPFKSRSNNSSECRHFIKTMESNMPFYGIKYEMMKAGSNLAANIKVHEKDEVEVPITINTKKYGLLEAGMKYNSRFWLGVNNQAEPPEELASLTHELGHLFCHHLFINDSWWKRRNVDLKIKEFEAESTAWLVCSRLGVDSRSVEYLSGYKDDDLIPPVSFESIFRAVNTIENMIERRLTYKDGYLYKFEEDFRKEADEMAAELRKRL